MQIVGRGIGKGNLLSLLPQRDYGARRRNAQNRGENQPVRMNPSNRSMRANHTNSYWESKAIQLFLSCLPNQFDMDAGLLRCDVCDFFEVLDPFWRQVASSGKGIWGCTNFVEPAMQLESILGYTFANAGR
jgi:hypothetical protein